MLEDPSPRDDGKSRPGAPWRSYKERLARLAQRLVDAQRPIRILNAVKWEPSVFERFRDSRWKNLPPVDAEYYARLPLGFDPDATIAEMCWRWTRPRTARVSSTSSSVPVLCSRAHEGVIAPPRYVPEMFRDMNGLAIWLGVSAFWGRLKSQAIQVHYEKLFAAAAAG